jgi:uncharacterized protein YgbK (DUF1537 family)
VDRGRLLILADDLTGALDSGVQLAHRGQRVVILTAPDVPFPDSSVYDVLVIDTETRHIGAEEAGKLVFSLVRQAKASGIRCFYKKTDSGLRGKVGAELQAVLLASGAERLHFIPAYPATDRKTIGGIQYVNGKPLAESIFSKDPIDPIHVSGVDEVIHLSADVPVKLCGAATVKQDNDACEFSGIIVHDASTMEDLAAIAERLEKADELYVTGGCAGFLEVYPMEASRDTKEALPALKERLFVLSGSVNDVTRKHRRRSYSGSSDSIPSLRKSTASCSSRIHRIPAGGIKRKTKSRGSLALRIKLETKSRRRLAGSIKQKKRSRRKLVF